MAIASKYWQFVGFNAAGQRRIEVLTTAQQFFEPFVEDLERHHPQKADVDSFIQRQLWLHAQKVCAGVEASPAFTPTTPDADLTPSALCLRCCVSHLIEQACVQLSQQFGQGYRFTHEDLLPLVLDANSRVCPPSNSAYDSLTTKILQNFNPDQGALATWTIRLVRSDRRLNEFLLDHGVYLISDWAILNDSKPQQVERILLEFHQRTPYEARAAGQLLRCYHAVYRGDRLKAQTKGRCYDPTPEQLQRIASYLHQLNPSNPIVRQEGLESAILDQLKGVAGQLRQYRILKRGGSPQLESIDAVNERTGTLQQLAAPQPDTNEQDEFLRQYRRHLKGSLDIAIETVVEHRLQNLKKKRRFQDISRAWWKGLYLFHCCDVSMGDIAHEIGLKAQYQVSRLLQLKAMRTDIRQEMLRVLGAQVFESVQDFLPHAQLQKVDQELDSILAEQVDDLLNQAAAEASTARSCHPQSLYAERLCHYLSRRMPS